MWLGVDTGGTFTDFVLLRDGRLQVHKVLSTPSAPEQAILQGMRDLGVLGQELSLVHGSTVATNAVLEGKGVDTVYITNRGFADILTIGRQARRALYDLQPGPVTPPLPASHCLEVDARLSASGEELQPLDPESVTAVCEAIARLQPQAVAVNLLFSFVDDSHEQAIASALPDELFVSLSSRVLPEYREYERGITTWLNAWVGPLVERYLVRLCTAAAPAHVTVMQSSAGTVSAEQAGRQAVNMLLSGPAGGMAGARFIGQACGHEHLLTFDMGGTSTDVALIDGDIELTAEGSIGHYPVSVPMVDMHTIGAGGGSIASVDAGGLLQVGPQSAGADPGPACYGQGGRQATVTDANLVLGRLSPQRFLGGAMTLQSSASEQVVQAIADQLSTDLASAATGIISVANEHMVQALRVMSVERGLDPRDFSLMCFGGAGGLHVCALAEALGMRNAIVPAHGGVLSALGMLTAPRKRNLSRTVQGLLLDWSGRQIRQGLDQLAGQASQALRQEGVADADMLRKDTLDLRYLGQSSTLEIAWSDRQGCVDAFHQKHRERYGHALEQPVELVNIRVAMTGPDNELQMTPVADGQPVMAAASVIMAGIDQPVAVFERDRLCLDQQITGPALITETVSTTWLAPGWRARVHRSQSLLLDRH